MEELEQEDKPVLQESREFQNFTTLHLCASMERLRHQYIRVQQVQAPFHRYGRQRGGRYFITCCKRVDGTAKAKENVVDLFEELKDQDGTGTYGEDNTNEEEDDDDEESEEDESLLRKRRLMNASGVEGDRYAEYCVCAKKTANILIRGEASNDKAVGMH